MTNLNKIKVAILGSPKVGKSGKHYYYLINDNLLIRAHKFKVKNVKRSSHKIDGAS